MRNQPSSAVWCGSCSAAAGKSVAKRRQMVCGQPGLCSLGQWCMSTERGEKAFHGSHCQKQAISTWELCNIPPGMDGTGCYLSYLHREQLWKQKQVLLTLFRAVIFKPSWFKAPLASKILSFVRALFRHRWLSRCWTSIVPLKKLWGYLASTESCYLYCFPPSTLLYACTLPLWLRHFQTH